MAMNFTDLYTNCSEQIREAIIRMWSEFAPQMVEQYRNQLEEMLKDNISNNIVVEDMSRWESVTNADWRNVIDEKLWRDFDKDGTTIIPKSFAPYKHQYECWKTALNCKKSFVVTSGTGSGKTECFMVPILQDLAFEQDPVRGSGVEALFLYPLNALMEDQRERINNFIKFSENGNCNHPIKFAVFNGSTAHTYSDAIPKLEHELVSRDTIRQEKPSILFTNPSMLEYMLLRKKDKPLFSDSLKWIVIDEAHTYSGSAGAELALLLRRVLKACGKKPSEVRFVTSSATIGNDDSQLKKFIADITGQNIDNIEIIKGNRSTPQSVSAVQAELLHKNSFVLLNELCPEGSLQEKLKAVDSLADQELRVRLHYFIKCLTSGFYIDPTADLVDGKFKLHTNIPLVNGQLDSHYLNACYCSECGAILGYGLLDAEEKYMRNIKPISTLDGEMDMFDDDDSDDDGSTSDGNDSATSKEFFIGIASSLSSNPIIVEDDKIVSQQEGRFVYSKIKKDGKKECPCCGANGRDKFSPLHSFHLSTDFIGRLIAPILLNQVSSHENAANDVTLPCNGCKYITFADSRQTAAGPTLKQNLETEEVWVIGVLYKELLKRRPLTAEDRQRIGEEIVIAIANNNLQLVAELNAKLQNNIHYLTWHAAMDALLNDCNCLSMCLAFAANDEDESIDELKRKYVLSALYRTMNKRPSNGKNSPENWGLISTYYSDIEPLNNREVPDEVKTFNNVISCNENRIESKDWHDFVKLFIDCNIRSNQSMFFKLYREENNHPVAAVKDWKYIDINDIRNYRTEEGLRRQIKRPVFSDSRYVMLLCRLLGKDNIKDLAPNEKNAISGVLDALWDTLKKCDIAEMSQKIKWEWKDKKRKFKEWAESTRADDIYMNVTRIAFKLYDETVRFDEHLKIPLDTTFKGYSPYPSKDGKYDVKCVDKTWSKLAIADNQNTKEWFTTNRQDIAHRWSVKLERILEHICSSRNTLYIQAEHTAQVARSVIKKKTEQFKQGKLNIMACSTTMEMGVDLGDLELVMMNNVPPHPANYKQRAGRAGRGSQNKSVSVTLCGADSLGKNLFDNPVKGFIHKEMAPPKIGLNTVSSQLVQRHINSALLRLFVAENDLNMPAGQGGATADDRGFRVNAFFTNYTLGSSTNPNINNKSYIRVNNCVGATVFPSGYTDIRTHQDSLYEKFLNTLNGWLKNDKSDAYHLVNQLIKGTSLEVSSITTLINNTKESLKAIAKDIHEELEAICKKWDVSYEANGNPATKKGSWLYWQFANVLNGMFISHLSNHQFIPNANMPTGIVELILKENRSFWSKSENPTRDLRTALSEYAPGSLVFIDGRTYRMAGVKWNETKPTMSVYHCAQGHTWISSMNDNCPICHNQSVLWDAVRPALQMITPTSYYPSSDVSRITKKEPVNNEIGVELIGVGDWTENKAHKLFAYRTNVDANNSQILYYDKGQHGYGYHICKSCGYAVSAPNINDGTKDDEIMSLMYSEAADNNNVTFWYHNYRTEDCKMQDTNDPLHDILQNIVLGGAIQTDYCEIALYTNGLQPTRMVATPENKKIATTLGLLLCNSLSQRFGFDRGEIDFLYRSQNNELSICIFDVAKGGSGRSKLLPSRITEFFDVMRTLLNGNVAIEHVLDRSTMRYVEHLDIVGALDWLEQEYKSRVKVPTGFPANVQPSSYTEIENAIEQEVDANNVYIFANNQFADWNYRCGKEHPCWLSTKMGMIPRGADRYNLVVMNAPRIVPAEYCEFPESMNMKQTSWSNVNYMPLAQVGNDLYITNIEDYTYLDEYWATDSVWRCSIDDVLIDVQDWRPIHDAEQMHEIILAAGTQIKTNELLDKLVCDALKHFYLNRQDYTRLTIECSDRYLISQLGMIITHQLINKIVALIGVDDYTIKYNINTSPANGPSSRVDDSYRRLGYTINSGDLLEFAKTLLNPNNDDRITIVGKRWEELNHDRWLSIKSDTGHTLIIKPDGGFSRGWYVDGINCNGVIYTPDNSRADTVIPIAISDADGRSVYYVIYKRPQM